MRPKLAALLGVLVACPAAAGAADFVVSKAIITKQSDMDVAMERSATLTDGFASATYVDWTIPYDIETERCDLSELAGGTFEFSPYGNFHALIAVTPGSPASNPLNDISCEGPERLRIRGFYFVLVSTIPEADRYDLRPLPITLETVVELKAAGAF